MSGHDELERTTEMARKLCYICNTRRTTPESPDGDMCAPCYDYAGWENTHSDTGHDDIAKTPAGQIPAGWSMSLKQVDQERQAMEICPVCLGKDPADKAPVKGHTNTVARSHTSHAGCDHARTPSARAACRKVRNAVA